MNNLIFFVVASAIWDLSNNIFAHPIANFLRENQIGPKNEVAIIGTSECIIAVILGLICGISFGPIIAISLRMNSWSWIATACLIISSLIFSN